MSVTVDGNNSLLARHLRRADWVTAVSGAALSQACELVPEITLRSSLIYNSVDVPSEHPTPLPIRRPRVLCLGRVIPSKGFDLALRAFGKLTDQFPNARLVFAGDGPTDRSCNERPASSA